MNRKYVIPLWWNKVEVAEAFALVILLTVLAFSAFGSLTLQSVTVQGIVAACLTAIFGSEVARQKRKKNKDE
jgi:hypothetical protein